MLQLSRGLPFSVDMVCLQVSIGVKLVSGLMLGLGSVCVYKPALGRGSWVMKTAL